MSNNNYIFLNDLVRFLNNGAKEMNIIHVNKSNMNGGHDGGDWP